MLKIRNEFEVWMAEYGMTPVCPDFEQVMSEEQLIDLVPQVDGWIIGDDQATRNVVASGKAGKLKAAVKWGVGTDNINFAAFSEYEIPVVNTPNVLVAKLLIWP